MVVFHLVQSTPIHDGVSNRNDGVLSHSPGSGSGTLQDDLSWGCTQRDGDLEKSFFYHPKAGVSHWKKLQTGIFISLSGSQFLSVFVLDTERTGEGGKPVELSRPGAVGGLKTPGETAVLTKTEDCGLKLKSLALVDQRFSIFLMM